METSTIWKFIFELGQLRRIKHEGIRLIGVPNPESVAEHSLRAAQIGFVLAKMEGYANPAEVATMLVFHDIGECRIGDLHKVAARYVEADEMHAVQDQLAPLEDIGKEIFSLWNQVEEKNTQAGIIAKDADYVEQAATAKEFMEQGFTMAQDWITNTSRAVKTDSAKKLLGDILNMQSTDWWQGLKKIILDQPK
ncbi:HD domain-containing protein [Candidatus Uhrbacteria bacterium]|nr:HD domain-containing protein [Candidatus Uhrbacteria bacterium]